MVNALHEKMVCSRAQGQLTVQMFIFRLPASRLHFGDESGNYKEVDKKLAPRGQLGKDMACKIGCELQNQECSITG